MALVKVSEVLKLADAANTSAIAFNCVGLAEGEQHQDNVDMYTPRGSRQEVL